MNKKDPLYVEKDYLANTTYNNLISISRTEDISLHFYAMEMEKQKAAEEDYRRFSWIYADILIEKFFKSKRGNMTERDVKKLIEECLKKAWAIYNGKKVK